MSPFIKIFNFFKQCFIVCTSLNVPFVPKCFILFDLIVSGIGFLLMSLESALFSGMVGAGVFEVVPYQIVLVNRG